MASAGYSSYPAYVLYVIDASIGSSDAANNRSRVDYNAYVYCAGSSASSSGGSGSIDGVNSGSIGYFSLSRYGTVGVTSGSQWVQHDKNGNLSSVSFSGSSSMSGLGSASVSGSISGFSNYDRRPGIPTFSSVTRTTTSVSITLGASSQPTGSPAADATTYYVDYSINGAAYIGVQSSTGTSFSLSGMTKGATYTFRTYARNSDSVSGVFEKGYAYSTVVVPNVPSAPSSCTAGAAAGREVTVTAGDAINNGATITGYYAQQSPDNGVTWQNAAGTLNGSDLMTSQSITYSGLTGGATYKFRVFAANEMGSGATTISSSVFVPSGGKRYDPITEEFINASKANRRNVANTAWVALSTTKKYVVSGAITNAVGNGTSVTYTASNAFTAGPGNRVTITGVTPTAYNVVNAVVTAATSTSFTVTSSATGTYSSSPSSRAAGWMEFV